jgi:HEAT repeat protein
VPTRTRRRSTPAWGISLQGELDGPFGYEYRRLSVERLGKRAAIREFRFGFQRDPLEGPILDPRRLVRQRVRSLDPSEAELLWIQVETLRPRLRSSYLTLGDPRDLDTSRDHKGGVIAIHTGEEGPACLTLRKGRPGEGVARRVLVHRYPREVPMAGPQRTALRTLVDLLEPGPLNYRRSYPVEDLCSEFLRLKASDFLNLRRFEARALEALGCLGDPAGIPTVAGELFAPDPAVRIQALEALVALAEEEARGDVELLCYDEDPRVRAKARALLG